MSTKDENEAKGCALMVGLFCMSIGVGYMFGPAAGWATFGAVLILLVIFT